jgi:outer membrane protein
MCFNNAQKEGKDMYRSGIAALLFFVCPAVWADAGDWLLRGGVTYIDPKSDNHPLVSVESAAGVTFNVSYFLTNNWSLELLAALPFTHDIRLNGGGGRVGETKHLPPTFSVQYHFRPDTRIRPYVGVGINWTIFFEEDTRGALEGTDLDLDDSVGAAAQVGVDFDLAERMFLNLDVRYIKIETDASVNGTSIGTVEIDPWLVGANVGFRF